MPSLHRLTHCPACGRGALFNGLIQFHDHCSHCGHHFSEHDAGDGPAYFMVMILSLVVSLLGIWVEFTFSPPLWLHALLWTPVILLGTIAGIRYGKALLFHSKYKLHHKP